MNNRAFIVALAVAALTGCNEEKTATPATQPTVAGASAASAASTSSAPESQTVSDPPELVVDTRSPDMALKSWWKVLDLREAEQTDQCRLAYAEHKFKYRQHVAQVATGEIRAYLEKPAHCTLDVFRREIQEVKAESETRAVVFVKIMNATPIPEGAVMDDYSKKQRETGARYKYIVEKTAEGWRIAEIYTMSSFAKSWEPEGQLGPGHVPSLVIGVK